MKTKNLFIASIIAASLSISFISCKKDNSTSPTTSAEEQSTVTMLTDGTSSELMYDDAFDVVNQSSEQSGLTVNSTGTGSATTQ